MDMVRIRMKDYHGTMILPGGRKLTPYDLQGIEVTTDVWDKVQIDNRLEIVEEDVQEDVVEVTEEQPLEVDDKELVKLKDRINSKNEELSQLRTVVQELEAKLENPITAKANELLNMQDARRWRQVVNIIESSDDMLLLTAMQEQLFDRQLDGNLTKAETQILTALMSKLAPVSEPSTEPVSLVGVQDVNIIDQSEE